MERSPIDVLLLLALPASGKSEVRRFLKRIPPGERRERFGIGDTLDLDDFPYVHFMRLIDAALKRLRRLPVFFLGHERPMQDPALWTALTHLLNEDYEDLLDGHVDVVPSAAELLLNRLDTARELAGMPTTLELLPHWVWREVAMTLESEARRHLEARNALNREDKAGKTIVIECARGGPHGSPMPIIPPRGYGHLLQTLSPQILERARILYVWVTGEQSYRKNIARGRPNQEGSILHHVVPDEVMRGDYGCDDLEWLITHSNGHGTINVERNVALGDGRFENRVFKIPVAVLDNRGDLTKFVQEQGDPTTWRGEDIQALQNGLETAMRPLIARAS